MDNPAKIHILLIVLLITINSWIAYTLFNLEGIEGNTDTTENSTVRVNDGSSEAAISAQREAETKKKKKEEQRKADHKKALDEYNNKTKPNYDAAVIAYKGCMDDKNAYEIALKNYYIDLNDYNNIRKPEYEKCLAKQAEFKKALDYYNKTLKPKYDADVIAYNDCKESKRVTKLAADAGKKLYNDKRVVTGSAITGSGIWGSSPSSSIFSRIRPETAYIWNSTKQVSGDRANFKYIYTNTTGSPFSAKMYIIADNYADFEFNGRYIKSFSRGGWPNLGFTNGLGPENITLVVGENTFIFKCRNNGGPAGFAVIVTDVNGNRLFNTESGLNNLNNTSGLNDGWQIIV